MITCALTREQVFDLTNDVYAHINANAETFDIDQYMTDLFDMVALQTGSVNRAAMFVQTAFAIINRGRSITAFKTLLDETKYREDAILDMVNRFTDPVEGLERIFIYIGFRPAGTLPSTAATGPTTATTTTTTPISAEEEEEEEKETSLVPGEKIVVSDVTYEDFELLPNTSEFAQLRALKQRLDDKFNDLKAKEPLLYRDINNFLKTTIARTIIEQYNTALSTGAVSPSRKKPDNIKLKTTGQEVTSDQSLLYVSSLYQSLKNKLSGLNKTDAGYADLQEDVNNLGVFLKELQSFRNKDVAIVEQEIEKVLNSIAARMQAIETGPDGKPVATSKAYLINEEEYARVSVIVEGILQRYFRTKPFGIVADINTYLNKLNSDLRVDRNLNVREHLEKFIGASTRNKITGAKALKILDEHIASKSDFLEVLANPTTPSNVLIEYFDDFGLLLSERLYDTSRDVGNEFDAGVRDFVADVDTSVKETELLSKEAAKQLEEILKPFREAVGQIASETEILFDEDTKIAGQMDLLFIDENQEWWIVDVKTGKAEKWKKYGLGTDAYKTYIRNALQQIIYKRILQKITGLDKVNLGILPLEVDYDDTTGKINSVEQPSKVKNQALSPEQPFITINENEKFLVFASDSVDDNSQIEMTLSQMVDEIFKERSAFVTEEETEDTEEETEEGGETTDPAEKLQEQILQLLNNRRYDPIVSQAIRDVNAGKISFDDLDAIEKKWNDENGLTDLINQQEALKGTAAGTDIKADIEKLGKQIQKLPFDTINKLSKLLGGKGAFKEIEDAADAVAYSYYTNKNPELIKAVDAELATLEGEGATGTGVEADVKEKIKKKIISKLQTFFGENVANAETATETQNALMSIILNISNIINNESQVISLVNELISLSQNQFIDRSFLNKQEQILLEKVFSALEKAGYEVIEMLGTEYYEGLEVIATFVPSRNPDSDTGKKVITRVIKPQINFKGQMIQAAQIEATVDYDPKYDFGTVASEKGAEETPTEIELTEDQSKTLKKIERRPRGEYIIKKAEFIKELIKAGNTLSGKLTYSKQYGSFTLEVTINGELVKLAVYIDNDKKEQYQDAGDKQFTISLLSESVIEDFGISMVYEDVLNVVDEETGEKIGRVGVTDTSVFKNKQDATNILREKISNATTAEELHAIKNDIVKFLIDYGYDETTDSLTKALDDKLDNLKISPIGEFDFFHKKDQTPSINTAYKIVSYNATKKEITVSLVTDPSVKETISTSEFMNTFDPIVDATETPAELTPEETLLLDITDENLQRVIVDPSFFKQEVTEDSKGLEDDLANNAKC
jgi:hypothetical protein